MPYDPATDFNPIEALCHAQALKIDYLKRSGCSEAEACAIVSQDQELFPIEIEELRDYFNARDGRRSVRGY